MDVILLERIENLGFMGDIVKVRPGYARNFLLPQHKALRKTDANLAYFEAQKVELEARNLKRKQEAEEASSRMAGVSLVLVRQASEGGQLYGSVTARDIADALREEGYTVGRSQVQLNNPIKLLGTTEVRISLHSEVAVTVPVTVARSLEEAERAAEAEAAAKAAGEAGLPEDGEHVYEEAEAAAWDEHDGGAEEDTDSEPA
ncbi:50S ribosomal protein L9 [Roseospira navarrensis]|uniref:Large ribosomal subunit protein bL9 n=1 Tax=Roseospira navarrensis TaxID=140058 RepID=A0A7X2D206_9PROT|nr:50S ribosomal protein L9 [Roseospira navarrensis]MQX35181.1 50S ribosomal protein L9 [Roseospira navarrensis]